MRSSLQWEIAQPLHTHRFMNACMYVCKDKRVEAHQKFYNFRLPQPHRVLQVNPFQLYCLNNSFVTLCSNTLCINFKALSNVQLKFTLGFNPPANNIEFKSIQQIILYDRAYRSIIQILMYIYLYDYIPKPFKTHLDKNYCESCNKFGSL